LIPGKAGAQISKTRNHAKAIKSIGRHRDFGGDCGSGILVGWWGSRSRRQDSAPGIQTLDGSPANGQPQTPPHQIHGGYRLECNCSPARIQRAPRSATNLLADWEDKLDEILGPNRTTQTRSRSSSALFARLPEDGQSKWRNTFQTWSLTTITHLGQPCKTRTARIRLDVLMSDVLNRPDSVKLPNYSGGRLRTIPRRTKRKISSRSIWTRTTPQVAAEVAGMLKNTRRLTRFGILL